MSRICSLRSGRRNLNPARTLPHNNNPHQRRHYCLVQLKIATDTPRFWGSQSSSGRSQRRSSRLTLQFRRPNHPGVSSGGKRDRESTESRRLSSVAERSRVAPAWPAVEGGRAASSATPFLPSVLWCGERQPCSRRSLARATRRRLSAVDAGHTPPGFVDRGGDQQEDGQVRGPNLMSAPALVTALGRCLPSIVCSQNIPSSNQLKNFIHTLQSHPSI